MIRYFHHGFYSAGFTTVTMEYQPTPSQMSGNVTYYCTLFTISGNIGSYSGGTVTLNY